LLARPTSLLLAVLSSIEQRGEFIACLLQADLEQGSHRADR
jgi:hypothetical protein